MKKLYVIPSVETYVVDQSDVLTVVSGAGDGTPTRIADGEYGIHGSYLFD